MQVAGLLLAVASCFPSAVVLAQAATPEPIPAAAPAPATDPEFKPQFTWPIERRQEQVRTEPGYLAAPVAVNIPGIGFFYGLLGSYFNILQTESDFFGYRVWGDIEGYGLGLIDLPVAPGLFDPLTLGIFFADQSAAIDIHRRGMDSDPDDVRRFKIDRFNLALVQASLKFFDKRLQFYWSLNRQRSKAGEILNKDGDKLADGSGDETVRYNRSYGYVVDITDDRSDPRRGVVFENQIYDRPESQSFESSYYVVDYNLTGYVPFGRLNTLVLNAYRSDAVVTRTGETDANVVREKIGIDCGSEEADNADCEEKRDQIVEETVSENRHGTASSLGGTQRLRSFVTNRFYAAHSMSVGTEFRWNLTDEFTPFNYFVAGGVRSGLQFAFFAEYGGVADLVRDLPENMTYSYGAGFRLLIASGFIVRFDIANGREGAQPTIIFSYPWNVF